MCFVVVFEEIWFRKVIDRFGNFRVRKKGFKCYLLLSTGRLNERVMELLLLCVGRIVFELFHKTKRFERRFVSFSQLMTVLMIITNFWGSEFGLFYSGLPRQLNRDIYIWNILSKQKKNIYDSLHFKNQVLFVYFYVDLLSNSLRAEVELKTFKIVFVAFFYRIYLKLKYRTRIRIYISK